MSENNGNTAEKTVAVPDFVPLHPQREFCNILYDFCYGARIEIPQDGTGAHIRIFDDTADTLLFDDYAAPGKYIMTDKKYYVKYRMEVKPDDEEEWYTLTYDPENEDVVFWMPVGTLGDVLAWFPSVAKWQEMHPLARCTVVMRRKFSEILERQYTQIHFMTEGEYRQLNSIMRNPYAIYILGLFFKGDTERQPYDFRRVGLAQNAAHILGVPFDGEPPQLDLSATRQVKEPYVCISAQASGAMKMWYNPFGWMQVVKALKESYGYRVLCIDREKVTGSGLMYQCIPYGAEDFTGDRPLQDRIDLLAHAEFFIGGASGLSWLAHACRIPVVLISGFSSPTAEFNTPYRVQNIHTCNSCWDDVNCDFTPDAWAWCPRHAGTPRQLECTRGISAKQVMETVKQLLNDKKAHKQTKRKTKGDANERGNL